MVFVYVYDNESENWSLLLVILYNMCAFFSCVFFLSVCVRWDLVHVSRFKEIFKPSFSATCEGHSPRFSSCKLRKKDKKETPLKEDIYRRGIKAKKINEIKIITKETHMEKLKRNQNDKCIYEIQDSGFIFPSLLASDFNGFEH